MDNSSFDSIKEIEALKDKLLKLDNCLSLNEYIGFLQDILYGIKTFVDNDAQIRASVKSHPYGKYVIELRNLCQHYKRDFKKYLEDNMSIAAIDKSKSIVIYQFRGAGATFKNLTFDDHVFITTSEEKSGHEFLMEEYRIKNIDRLPFENAKLIVKSCFNFTIKEEVKKKIHYKEIKAPNESLLMVLDELIKLLNKKIK